jgi:hypothetical protein
MADYSQLLNLEKKPQKSPVSSPVKPVKQTADNQEVEQQTSKPTSQLTNPSINQSMRQSINKANKVMDKPRGFYITEGLNQRIDEAVRYYQEKHNLKKVDRSLIVTALLDNETNWTEETLDLLIDKVISHLTNRLTNR